MAQGWARPRWDICQAYMTDNCGSNFIGEKIVRRVVMHPGVDVEPSKNQKDELQLTGISLENVSQSAADIQQSCKVRNKDIRKVCNSGSGTKQRAVANIRTVLGRNICVGARQHHRGLIDDFVEVVTGNGFDGVTHLLSNFKSSGACALAQRAGKFEQNFKIHCR
jgi:hypothetical protein